jgi:hypothetical protein
LDSLAKWLLQHRVLVLGLIALVTLVSMLPYLRLGEAGAYGLFDFRPERIFASEDASFERLEEHHRIFGRGDRMLILMLSGPAALGVEAFARLPEWTKILRELPGIERAESLASVQVLREGQLRPFLDGPVTEPSTIRWTQEARAHPPLAGGLISTTESAQALFLWIEPELQRTYEYGPVVEEVQRRVSTWQLPGTHVDVTGLPALRPAFLERMFEDQLRNIPITGVLFVVLLAFLFRDWKAVLFPVVAVNVAVLWLLGFLFGTGGKLDPINNVITTLIFVIAMSDGIHLLERYGTEVSRGARVLQGLKTTISRLASTCFVTSLTTAIGFASLGLTDNFTLASFGLYGAAGVLFAYLAVVTVLPLLLSFFGPLRDLRQTGVSGALSQRLLEAAASLALRYPRPIVILGVVLLGGAIFLTSGLRIQNNLMEGFAPDDPVAISQARVSAAVGGVLPIDVQLRWSEGFDPRRLDYLQAVEELQQEMLKLEGVDHAISRVDLLKEYSLATHGERVLQRTEGEVGQALVMMSLAGEHSPLESLFQPAARAERIAGRLRDVGGQRAVENTQALQATATELLAEFPEVEAYVTGDGPVGYQGINDLVRDLWVSLLLAFVVIFLVMLALLRSVRASALAMLPNVVPLLLTAATIKLSGLDLRVSSVIVFAIALGLAVDDTIHFLARFREEFARLGSYPEAIRATYGGAGRAILATTLLLGLGFSVLLLSPFPVTRHFGFLLEITLLAALLGDLLLLPAALVLFKPFGPAPGTNE